MKRKADTPCAFTTSDSWVILSPIERSIKQKIEAVGTPLKEWNIQINYGIKTGCNEAFIIDEAKRAEILSWCKDDAERARTTQIIRPILRGRDIKRYGYEWAHLYLIATFPSFHLDIDDYPAIKKHLLSFGKERLEQTGKEHIINGVHIKSRKKSNNKWFETQDTIGYWDDFKKPKIVWAETMRIHRDDLSKFPRFAIVDNKVYTDKTCFIGTGKIDVLKIALGILNSKVGRYQLGSIVSKMDDGGWLMQKIYIEKVWAPLLSNGESRHLIFLVDAILSTNSSCSAETALDTWLYGIYGLSVNEINHIEKIISMPLSRR